MTTTPALNDDLVRETWKAIPGFDGIYEASDMGRIRSFSPMSRIGNGILRQHDCSGYLRVSLYRKGVHRPKLYLVHRMVLLAFVGECPPGQQTRHLNGNSKDNRLTNIKWGTRKENARDRLRHGRFHRANINQRALSDSDAAFIRKNHKIIKQTTLAEMFGVHRATIQRIHAGERYAQS